MNEGMKHFGRLTLALGLVTLTGQAFAQCTTSAWSAETGTTQAVGSNGANRYEQDCGLTVQAASAPGYVTTTAPTDETEFYTRFYFYPAQLDLSSGDADVFVARNGGTVQVRLSVREVGGEQNLVARYRSNGGLVEATPIPLRPVWQAVNVGWTTGAGNGSLTVKIDGFDRINLTNLQNNGELVNEMDLGIINDPSGTGPVVFDAFETRRALPEPPLLATNRLINISTRTPVGAGFRAAVAGFIIEGDTQKCIIVRGKGPSVGIGLTKLQDPRLVLKRAGNPTVIAENDNWTASDDDADIVIEQNRDPDDANEAAFHACLDPGAWTAELRGVDGTTLGIGNVEVFEADVGTPFLKNISTRSEPQGGGRRAVAGFAIRGDEPRTVLVLGRGPSVAGNPAKLLNPILEIRDTNGGTVVATNDDWATDSNTGTGTVQPPGNIPANLQPTVAAEAGILIELPPGNYTAFLGPAPGSDPGIGIVEVFDVNGGSIAPN
jgi:hypothetical protein